MYSAGDETDVPRIDCLKAPEKQLVGLQDRQRPHFGHYLDLDEHRVAADAAVGADPVDLHFDPAAKAETAAC